MGIQQDRSMDILLRQKRPWKFPKKIKKEKMNRMGGKIIRAYRSSLDHGKLETEKDTGVNPPGKKKAQKKVCLRVLQHAERDCRITA